MKYARLALIVAGAMLAGCSVPPLLKVPDAKVLMLGSAQTSPTSHAGTAALNDVDILRLIRLQQLAAWTGSAVDLQRGLCTVERWRGPIGPGSSPRDEQLLMRAWEGCNHEGRTSREDVTSFRSGAVSSAVDASAGVLARLIDPHRQLQECLAAKPPPTLETCTRLVLQRPLTGSQLKAIADGSRWPW